MKKLMALLLACCAWMTSGAVFASEEGGVAWDKFPVEKVQDLAALQNGAKLFVNYCLNCHSAAFARYNRIKDLGLSEEQIKNNLLFTSAKVGDVMKIAMDPKEAKAWFGAIPPDLTLVARSRASHQGSGADYLYTYLRSFYRDAQRPTGWNNLVFPNVGMPHVLWELQGQHAAKFVEEKNFHDPSKTEHHFEKFEPLTPGTMTQNQYDSAVGDLVAFLQWMSEPMAQQRFRIGVGVLIFLALFTLTAWRLNAAFWKDIR
jgi:ubiquinol-cytochrome c reductase cytochrome c1 subunit